MSAINKANDWFKSRSNHYQRCLYYNNRREFKPAYPSTENKCETKDEMAIPIDVLRNLVRFSKVTWYIVADLNVLFHDISFLRSYIVGDPKCQLLTPIAILNKIDTMCLSDPTGIASSARQALAQLEACSRHVRFDDDVGVKESPDRSDDDAEEISCSLPRTTFGLSQVRFDDDVGVKESPDRSDDDAEEILQCCLKTMSHGFHVVLITRSFGLQLLAEIRGVYVYDVQEIKRGVIKNKLDGRNIVDSNRQVTRTHNGYLCIRYTPARPPAIERNAAASERRRRNLMRHISFSRN